MASEVKTNKVSPATSTTLNVGDSGDTLALAVDAVTGLKVGSDAAGDILYYDGTDYTRREKPGTPADEVLTFATGATAPTWVAAAGGGLTAASMWRLTTDFTGSATPIASNLEEADAPVGFGVLGSSMTEALGIFTFPSTGYWLITIVGNWSTSDSNIYLQSNILTTTDNSTYVNGSEGITWLQPGGGTPYAGATCSYIMDVVSTSLCKCKFDIKIASGTVTTRGATDVNKTYMTFLRLADT